MDKEIVIVVPTEVAAYEVVRALGALDAEGSIELYTSTVVEKRADGTVDVKEDRNDRPAWGTAIGLTLGALVGLLAGPVGAAVGASIGGAAGLGSELAYSGIAGDFVRDVGQRLEPGRYAVCASVWEDWTAPVDLVASSSGGMVFRQATDDVAIAQIRAEMQSLREDEAQLAAEIAVARDADKARLEAKRDELQAKQRAQRERLKERAKKLQATWEAKTASIQQKTAAAKAEAKARHQAHMDKLAQFAALQRESFRELFA
jgi:uncharacterized membrane protein